MARARNSKGRFVKRHSVRRAAPARRRRAKRNVYSMNPIANPRRRARRRPAARRPAARRNMYSLNPRRRHARRNPVRRRRSHPMASRSFFGFMFPALPRVAAAGAGLIATPMVEGFVGSYFPSIQSTLIGRWALKIGAVLGLTWVADKVVGRSVASDVAIGGGAYLVLAGVTEFAPGLLNIAPSASLPKAGTAYYNPGSIGSGMGSQPLLGRSAMADVPDRLDPRSRF